MEATHGKYKRGKTHKEIVNFQAQSFFVVFVRMNLLHPILCDITLHEEKKTTEKSKCSIHGKSIFQQFNAAKDPSQFMLSASSCQ